MIRYLLTIFTVFFVIITTAQTRQISGRILDAQTRKPLPFANITYDKDKGTISDFDGKFELRIPAGYSKLTVSYIGYLTKSITLETSTRFYKIYLTPSAEQLREVVIQGHYVNPAVKLMRKAIERKKQNNYQTALKKYSYTKYIKFLIGADVDKVKKLVDTVYRNGKIFRLDSSFYDFKQEFADKYAWIFENVAKVNASNGNEKAEVIATRTAGLKKPFFALIALSLSGQNVYNDQYKLAFQPYLGPFSKQSFKTYRYKILDTVTIQNRPVIVVAYRNTTEPLISGKIYLDKQTLAIARFTLNTFKYFQLKSKYDFDYFPAFNIWFPRKMTMFYKKTENSNGIYVGKNLKILTDNPDSIYVTPRGDTIYHPHPRSELDYVYARFLMKIFDIRLEKNYPEKITYNLQVAPLAAKRGIDFWEQIRGRKYTPKERNTYHQVDSASRAEHLEYTLDKYKRLAQAYYPLTEKLDLDLMRLLDYNLYEGFRLKIGVSTNENFSDKWRIYAYAAYGFKDAAFKYGGALRYKLHHQTQTYLGLSFIDDLQKSAGFTLHSARNPLQAEIRFANDRFYRNRMATLHLSRLIYQNLKADLAISQSKITTLYYIPQSAGTPEPRTKDLVFGHLSLEWAPFSRFFLTSGGRKTLKNGYPVFYFDMEKNIPRWQKSVTDYYRIQLQTYFKKTFVGRNYSELFLRVGWASAGAGIDKLFMPVINSFPGANPLQRFNVASRFAFETMNDMEFLDNFVATMHFRHTFTNVKLSEKHTIDIGCLLSSAYGWSYEPEKYVGIRSLNKGYYETGLELMRIWSVSGLGFYYRFGPYAHPNFLDNLSVRLTVRFSVDDLNL